MLTYIDTIMYEESLLQAYDIIATYLDQLKSKLTEIENNGITNDLLDNVNGLVYASTRLEIKELKNLSKHLKTVMGKVEFKEAINGTWYNEALRESIEEKEYEEGEKWHRLGEICEEYEVELIVKDSVKKYIGKKDVESHEYRPPPSNIKPLEEIKDDNEENEKKEESDNSSSGDIDLMNRLEELRN